MKLLEALKVIARHDAPSGYRVHFERRERSMLIGDYFPEHDEYPIESEEEAWSLAERFARKSGCGTVANVYVINAKDFTPVVGYAERKLNRI